jgi:thioredoxin
MHKHVRIVGSASVHVLIRHYPWLSPGAVLEQFEMDDELEEIRNKKLKELQDKMNKSPLPDVPIVLTDADMEQALIDYPKLVVDCWAVWCGPCKMVAPTIEAMAKEKAGEIVFGKLDIDNNMQTGMKYQISAVPTMLVFNNGKHVGSILGALPKQQLEVKIAEMLK